MGRIDETRPFLAVNIAVLTVSDTRTLETDTSGATPWQNRIVRPATRSPFGRSKKTMPARSNCCCAAGSPSPRSTSS